MNAELAETDKEHATVSGQKVHRSDFAYVGDSEDKSTWKLPIHDAAHVRNALARYGQTDLPPDAKEGVWRKITAAAKKFGIEVSEKESEVRSQESELSDVRNGLVRLAIAYTGSFDQHGKKFSITSKDLEQMAETLGSREVPIDYEHLSGGAAPPGWAKAAGWIRKPDAIEKLGDGREMLWAWAELTPACLAMIKQKEYRYFSPEIHWGEADEHGEKIGTRLASGAMTNRPFLKDLPPIEISDDDYQSLFGLAPRQDGKLAAVSLSEAGSLVSIGQVHVPQALENISVGYNQPVPIENRDGQKETTMKKLKFKKLAAGKRAVMDDAGAELGEVDLDDLELDDAEMQSFVAKRGKKMTELFARDVGAPGKSLDEIRAALDSAEKARARLTEAALFAEIAGTDGRFDRVKAARLTDQGKITHEQFVQADETAAAVERAIQAGKVLPARRAAALRLALSDRKAFDEMVNDAKPIVDAAAHGVAGTAGEDKSASAQVEQLVAAYCADKKLDPVKHYAKALEHVTKKNPELWRMACRETEAAATLEPRA